MADEDPSAGGHGSALPEVLRDRAADPLRQGQFPRPPPLAARDAQDAPAPIQVLEAQRRDLAGAQAEVDLTAGHGIVAATRRSRTVEGVKEPAKLVIGHRPRETIQRPAGDARDSGHQGRGAMAVELEEPE